MPTSRKLSILCRRNEEKKISELKAEFIGDGLIVSSDSASARYFEHRKNRLAKSLNFVRRLHHALVEVVQHAWHHDNIKLYQHLLELETQGGAKVDGNCGLETFLQGVLSALHEPRSSQLDVAFQS